MALLPPAAQQAQQLALAAASTQTLSDAAAGSESPVEPSSRRAAGLQRTTLWEAYVARVSVICLVAAVIFWQRRARWSTLCKCASSLGGGQHQQR
jgi:hypothetical protein